MSKSMNEINTKYAVKLGINTGSFYDPVSGCNLFLNTPYYLFNNEPTLAIKKGVAGGQLIDLKGNIFGEEPKKQVRVEAKVEAPAKEEVSSKEEAKKSNRKNRE